MRLINIFVISVNLLGSCLTCAQNYTHTYYATDRVIPNPDLFGPVTEANCQRIKQVAITRSIQHLRTHPTYHESENNFLMRCKRANFIGKDKAH